MKTYIINMKKDVVKRNNILKQLKYHPKLDVEIIEACEGSKLNESELTKLGYPLFKKIYGNFGTLPAFGCSVSHISVYNKIITNENPLALILEDDVILGNELSEALLFIADFLYNTDKPTAILLTPDFIYNLKDEVLFSFGDYKMVNFITGYMATGYLINNAGAKLLAEKLRPICHVADDWVAFKKLGLRIFGIIPHLVSFSGELGEIGKSQRLKREPVILQIRHFLGRGKAQLNEFNKYLKGYRRSKRLW